MTEEMKNVTPETAEAPEHVETMEDYKEELEASFKQIHEGDILTGTVIGVSESAITLDLKYYTDGIIRLEDFTNDPNFNLAEDIHVGDEISATVIRRDDGEGHILLSAKEANEVLAWDKLRKYKEEGTNLKVKIAGIVKSGVVAYLEGIRGFIPASKLDLNYVEEDALNDWLGKEIEVRVITADEDDDHLVLSAREILREKAAEERKAKISNVEIGLVTEGTVESIQPYGAFIDLGNGLSGSGSCFPDLRETDQNSGCCPESRRQGKSQSHQRERRQAQPQHEGPHDVAAEEIQEETIELPESEAVTTSLGSLFANIKL